MPNVRLVVPSQYLTLSSVIDSTVERETGSLLQDVLPYRLNFSEALDRNDIAMIERWLARDDQQKDQERRLQAARTVTIDRLHQALVDGVLKAVVQTTMGAIFPLPVEYWRSQFGREAFTLDRVKWWQSTTLSMIPLEGSPLIEREEFDRWSNADATAGDELRLRRWLMEQMRRAPNEPRTKAAMVLEAKAAALRFTSTMFDRAWSGAAREANTPKWSEPGRRSKNQTD